MDPIPINLVVEDELSEAVVSRLLDSSPQVYATRVVYNRGGYGYIKARILGFNRAAKGEPYLVLTDLDAADCPPSLISDWFGAAEMGPNLVFRVAVHQVEAWLLADRATFADFVGVREGIIPKDIEGIKDAKKKTS